MSQQETILAEGLQRLLEYEIIFVCQFLGAFNFEFPISKQMNSRHDDGFRLPNVLLKNKAPIPLSQAQVSSRVLFTIFTIHSVRQTH